MAKKLNCVMLIDHDKHSNLIHKNIIDEGDYSNYIIKKDSVMSALTYLLSSASLNGNLPYPDVIFIDENLPGLSGWDF